MRLFIAADLSESTRAAFDDAASQVRAALPGAPAGPRLTWVSPPAAHVTLRFIGEVGDAVLPAIESALMPAVAQEPFEVTWQPIGTFPAGRRPRVVWMGALDGGDGLVTLAARIDESLRGVLSKREGRPFAPHITIARVKDAGRGVDWRRVVAGVRSRATVTHVDHVTLYQSHVGPKGSTYTVRLRIPLQ
jgi:2'-5' RNA ligase